MKFGFIFIALILSGLGTARAQEFIPWNPADFNLNRKSIDRGLEDFDFGLTKSRFDLPSGKFLNVERGPVGVDMVALIEERKNFKPRTVDLGTPLPVKEKKSVEFSSRNNLNDRTEVENDALNSNPYYRNQRIYQNALHNAGMRSMYGRRYYYYPSGRYF